MVPTSPSMNGFSSSPSTRSRCTWGSGIPLPAGWEVALWGWWCWEWSLSDDEEEEEWEAPWGCPEVALEPDNDLSLVGAEAASPLEQAAPPWWLAGPCWGALVRLLKRLRRLLAGVGWPAGSILKVLWSVWPTVIATGSTFVCNYLYRVEWYVWVYYMCH